jgi:hypothetical protein
MERWQKNEGVLLIFSGKRFEEINVSSQKQHFEKKKEWISIAQ